MLDFDYKRDFMKVYNLFTKEAEKSTILCKPDHNDVASFEKWFLNAITNDFNDFKVFYLKNRFIGFAYSYDFNLIDQRCCVSAAVESECSAIGFGSYCGLTFSKYLFDSYPLKSLYYHVYSYNKKCIKGMEALGANLCATLPKYHYYENKFNDLLIYSLDREYLYNKHKELFGRKNG